MAAELFSFSMPAVPAVSAADEREFTAALPQPLPVDRLEPLREHAIALIGRARSAHSGDWLDLQSFLSAFPISEPAGVNLLRLAEALPRTHDNPNQVALLADKVEAVMAGALLEPASAAVGGRIGSWARGALRLAERMLPTASDAAAGGGRSGPAAALVRPVARFAVASLGKQFVFGDAIGQALKLAARGRSKAGSPLRYSFDMLGEGARTWADADVNIERYRRALEAVARSARRGAGMANDGLSIKVSAIHPRYEVAHFPRERARLLERLVPLFEAAARADINLTIDAEESERLPMHLDLFAHLARLPSLREWAGLGLVVQAYQLRALSTVDVLLDCAWARRADGGAPVAVRLVKGAYWDAEIKRAQELGLDGYPVFTEKLGTDRSYLACADRLLANVDAVFPQFATHNAVTIAALLELAKLHSVGSDRFELQRLHGMGEAVHGVVGPIWRQATSAPPPSCRVYAPVGDQSQLLAYLIRRMLENGASTSFVRHLADASIPDAAVADAELDGLVAAPDADPTRRDTPRPYRIPRPPQLFGASRRNAVGLDPQDPGTLARLVRAVQATFDASTVAAARESAGVYGGSVADGERRIGGNTPAVGARIAAAPEISAADAPNTATSEISAADARSVAAPDTSIPDVPGTAAPDTSVTDLRIPKSPVAALRSPADRDRLVGTIRPADERAAAEAVGRAAAAFEDWQLLPVETRAGLLDRWADALEADIDRLVGLCVAEAGKSLADAVADVREAVDFCRFYAVEARRLMQEPQVLQGATGEHNVLRLAGRGVFVCISPWNFPVAIFVGQADAALVTGNTVVAKPAEQTPLIALRAGELAVQAGIPGDVLQVVAGSGDVVGAALVADPRIAGVVFTGSNATAKAIQRSLCDRHLAILPLIAETGGQNAMIVDSTALAEQVVDAVMQSAFRSAGQRCSALRVLAIQDDVADRLVEMVEGAMQTLVIGDPADPATDVGPVIDEEARTRLAEHVAAMRAGGRPVRQLPLPDTCDRGSFFAPTIIEIDDLAQLDREHFGPILHVLRFPIDRLDTLIDDINRLGFGLTLGIHTRIDARAEHIRRRARVGNVYVNRNMIGAVVGVQPFGGDGLSGTGPKAGGPHYLLRFVTERTLTVNTAAAGGNLALLAG